MLQIQMAAPPTACGQSASPSDNGVWGGNTGGGYGVTDWQQLLREIKKLKR
jgi:hypothetical protein